MKKILRIATLSILILIYSCSNSNSYSNHENLKKVHLIDSITKLDESPVPIKKITLDSFYDSKDKKKYPLVKIGKQVWMAKNLHTFKFRNGEKIPRAKSIKEWIKAGENKKPAWCYYENNQNYGEIHGVLYNWYAVHDKRKIAPKGFHIPSKYEWEKLKIFLGEDRPGSKIKAKFGCNTKENNSEYRNNETNSSQFSGLVSGTRGWSGKFFNLGNVGYWWSTTEHNSSNAFYRYVRCYHELFKPNDYSKFYGMSIRCLKDDELEEK